MQTLSQLFATSIVFLISTFISLPARSQSVNSCLEQAKTQPDAANKIVALSRAKNLARQAAEAANGGLNKYRAENSMHGSISQVPCTDNGDGTWTFNFKGTTPGDTIPIVESAVTVNSQTFEVRVDRNTALR
ncbi:MAG: hypothetical protein SAK29_13770 [Scytonema sp. PMC 1069.18]|nr:hypothetical protein [Scytonema sp. PMC 1069.18]MEC4882066.1 hypothetical protein [Scytonema sp. PMC 1070.18]